VWTTSFGRRSATSNQRHCIDVGSTFKSNVNATGFRRRVSTSISNDDPMFMWPLGGDYRAVVTSSRHRPFCFHNFVFLLNCLFVSYNAHRISVCVIAVSISHEFLLKVRRLSSFSRRRRLYAFTSTRRNFFHDDARDLTSTTSRRFFHDVGH